MTKVRQFGVIYVFNKPQMLRLVLAKKVSPQIDLKLDPNIDITELRGYLSQFIQENEDMELTFVEHLMFISRI